MKNDKRRKRGNMKRNIAHWKIALDNGVKKMRLDVQFKDFNEAFGFIGRVALISESLGHHAEIINCYNKVTLKLHTHDKNKITDLDKKMAKLIYKILT